MDTRLNKVLVICLFILFFLLSDIYYQAVGRIFDYIAILIFLGMWVFNFHSFRSFQRSYIVSASLLLVFIVFPWLLMGVLNESVLASAALLIGLAFVFPLSYYFTCCGLRSSVEKSVNLLILLNALVLLGTYLTYHIFGVFFDIPSIFGSIESRALNVPLNYFRPSGIYQEPNAYCTVMFSLLAACSFMEKRSRAVEILGIITIALTKSLWGMGSILLLVYLLYGIRGLRNTAIVVITLFYTATLSTDISIDSIAERSVTVSRVVNLSDDPSRQARYGDVENVSFNIFFFIGHGVDSKNFQSLAANGIAFMIYCFGFIGSIIVFVYLLALNRANHKHMLAIVFLLSTYPLFSYMYFWFWLGITLAFIRSSPKIRTIASA
ncbi:hypothetical protein EOPP23_15160 [Endozoicomonas sp. OPT23]|uniref:hypothetical protein n=1 Tax=Endozoicomonas sp. OPT23 TaxID=2072845 RepID=UPI00129B4EDD|nr:hypothetical protein [Endozoicomonas sp. OPT23]MRI34327.1 hypothetical protein [Endozoicomonas sp. OPT23]